MRIEKMSYLFIFLFIFTGHPAGAQTAEELTGKAWDYALDGQGEKAWQCLNKAIEKDPEYAHAYYAKGIFLQRGGRYQEALKQIDKAIKYAPNFRDAYDERAYIKEKLGDLKGAEEDRRKRQQLIKDGKSYLLERANEKLEQAEEALKDQKRQRVGKTGKMDPKSDYARTLLERARLKSKDKDYKGAIKDYNRYQQTVELINSVSFALEAEVQKKMNDLDGALKTYTEMITYFPESTSGYEKRAELYEKMGKEEKAELDRAAIEFLHWENIKELENRWTQRIKDNRNKKQAYLYRAKDRIQLNNLEGALADYKKALKLTDPDDKSAKLWLEAGIKKTQQDLAKRDEQEILKQQAIREKGEALVKKYKKKHLEMKIKEAQPDPDAASSTDDAAGKTATSKTAKKDTSKQSQTPQPGQIDKSAQASFSGPNYALIGLIALVGVVVALGVVVYVRRKRQ